MPTVEGSKLVLLAAGGTGGHLFPAQALATVLQKRGAAVELATDHRAAHFEFPARAVHIIPSATLRGRNPFSLARTATLLSIGTAKAWLLVRRIRPAVVVGFGGYPSVPPLMAASMREVPTVLHEQNGVMGRANRLLAPRVTAIATGFGDHFDMEKAKQEMKNIAPLVKNEINREIPTFMRDKQPREVRGRQRGFFAEEDDDQYDIPTFLRKSVD